MLKEEEENLRLLKVVDSGISKSVMTTRNKNKSWARGYNKDHDIVIISTDGTLVRL